MPHRNGNEAVSLRKSFNKFNKWLGFIKNQDGIKSNRWRPTISTATTISNNKNVIAAAKRSDMEDKCWLMLMGMYLITKAVILLSLTILYYYYHYTVKYSMVYFILLPLYHPRRVTIYLLTFSKWVSRVLFIYLFCKNGFISQNVQIMLLKYLFHRAPQKSFSLILRGAFAQLTILVQGDFVFLLVRRGLRD